MGFISGYSTEMTADELIAGLIPLYMGNVVNDRGEPITTMPVMLVSDSGKKKELILRIVPTGEPIAPVADTSWFVHCQTVDGYKVDFILPPDEQRVEGILSAIAFIDPRLVE